MKRAWPPFAFLTVGVLGLCGPGPLGMGPEGHSAQHKRGPSAMRGDPKRHPGPRACRALAAPPRTVLWAIGSLFRAYLQLLDTELWKCCLLISSPRACPFDVKRWSWWNLPLAGCLPSGLRQIQNSSSLHVWKTGRIYRNLDKHCEK